MIELETIRDFLRAIIGSDFPSFIDREAYRLEMPVMWSHNPARAFLRLTDADQAKVLQELRGPK